MHYIHGVVYLSDSVTSNRVPVLVSSLPDSPKTCSVFRNVAMRPAPSNTAPHAQRRVAPLRHDPRHTVHSHPVPHPPVHERDQLPQVGKAVLVVPYGCTSVIHR